jgi:penicillin-binding protein 1C
MGRLLSANKLLAALALVLLSVGVWRMAGELAAVPSFDQVRDGFELSDARLLDRRGEIIHEQRVSHKFRRLEWTALPDISPKFVETAIFAEDRNFFRHCGVDWLAVAAALRDRLLRGSTRGASTITMQTISMIRPDIAPKGKNRSLVMKAKQMLAAMALERAWSKKQILEAYLNLAGYRAELSGVNAMARGIFGKSPEGLDIGESLIAAALLRSPNAPPAMVSKRAFALGAAMGTQPDRARIELLSARLNGCCAITPRAFLAPHAALALFGKKGGAVKSSLDAGIQAAAVEALARHVGKLKAQNVTEGAVIALDNQTGEALAYAGGAFVALERTGVDGAKAKRQAGSALKPFLYALAIDRRIITSASPLSDTPFESETHPGIYRPGNYDKQFRGRVSARVSLASSLNIPAVRVADLLGPDEFVATLGNLGLTGLKGGEHYGLSIALGTADVSLWELTNAYRTLANGGMWSPASLTVDSAHTAGRRVFSGEAVFIVSDILSDRSARSETFGLDGPLATPFWSAVKTGTSKDMRDNWCVGYSRRYTVGVWVGNFGGEPMRNVSGVSGAAPIWLAIMRHLNGHDSAPAPERPANVVSAAISDGGGSREELFIRGTEPGAITGAKLDGAVEITYPTNGAIMALDPDIPTGNQKILFQSQGTGSKAVWTLDGGIVGRGGKTLWAPRRGGHELSIADGGKVDKVTFAVK